MFLFICKCREIKRKVWDAMVNTKSFLFRKFWQIWKVAHNKSVWKLYTGVNYFVLRNHIHQKSDNKNSCWVWEPYNFTKNTAIWWTDSYHCTRCPLSRFSAQSLRSGPWMLAHGCSSKWAENKPSPASWFLITRICGQIRGTENKNWFRCA